MARRKPYQPRNYAVGHLLLGLRSQTGLTQAALGALLGVSRRSVQKWEGGEAYPSAERLRQLIAIMIERGGFTRGHERAEAEALWEQVRADAPQRMPPCDAAWLEQLVPRRDPEPAPRSPAPAPSTPWPLPAPLTPFIGRDVELEQIAQLLADPNCRLLTICGPGGMGKTRLALEVAARHAHAFASGAAFVELASVSAANQIAATIGETLRLSFTGEDAPTEQLLRHLQPLQLLLVLDNLEHLLDDAELITAILRRAPAVTILATSRERLHLSAEWIFDVAGLAYPSASAARTDPLDFSAVRLFTLQARRVHPHFSPSPGELEAIISICRYVAGMPLAVELAAAWTRSMTVAEIARQTHADLDVLATSLRDVPARHRSLRAVFDHSWGTLNEREQTVFARLAVFRGGCTAVAAARVAQASRALLAALIDKSLLRQERTARDGLSTPDEPRFTMLEPVREYALEQLAASGALATIQRSHAAYYLEQAEATAAARDGAAERWMHQMERDADNVRAALRWALDNRERAFGLRLAEALWLFWRRRGYLHEGRQWLADIMALAHDGADPIGSAPRTSGSEALAWLASDEQSFAQAAALFARGVTLQRTVGRVDGLTEVLISGARQARSEGDYARATALLEHELRQYRALVASGSLQHGMLIPLLQELAMVRREQGAYDRSSALWQECLDLQRAQQDRVGIAVAQMGLSDVARDRGDPGTVRALCEQSLPVFREIGEARGIGYCVNNLALAAFMEADLDRAAALIDESVTLFRALQAGPSMAEVLVTRGRINAAQGNRTQARDDLSEALRIARAEGPRWQLAAALEALGEVFVHQGRIERALPLLSAAITLRTTMGIPIRAADQVSFDQALAIVRATLGDTALVEAATRPVDQRINEAVAGTG